MEAPRGVEVSAAKGPLRVSSRKDLQLESTEGEVRTLKVAPVLLFFELELIEIIFRSEGCVL